MTGQDLKNSILQLAIQGKLVAQDANDEPASVLLERIKAEKKKLIEEKKIKKEKPLPEITEDEKPFEIPEGWVWCRLGEIGVYKKGPFGSALTKSMFVPKGDESVKVYEQKNAIQKDYTLGDYYITKKYFEEMRGFEVFPGDIIISCAGTIGETYIIPENAPQGIINQALMRVKLIDTQISEYWLLFFKYILLHSETIKGNGSAIKNIPPFDIFKNYLIALPPLSEQRRIVAKIEKLMPLVDEYDKAQKELDSLNSAMPEQLKQSLLQEAIMGKLGTNNPDDEPASVLLQRIKEEKAQLIKDKKIKKEKPLPEITEDEIPFEIPDNWVWCRMIDIALDSADGPFGSNLKREHYTDSKQVRIIQLSNIGENGWKDQNTKYTTYKHLKNIERSEAFPGDIIIAKMMPAGRAIICPDCDKKYVLSSDAVRFDFSTKIYRRYLYWAINSSIVRNQIYDEVQGITRVRTSLNKLRTYLIPLPPLAEQHRIVEKIENLFACIEPLAKDVK